MGGSSGSPAHFLKPSKALYTPLAFQCIGWGKRSEAQHFGMKSCCATRSRHADAGRLPIGFSLPLPEGEGLGRGGVEGFKALYQNFTSRMILPV
jgi:hypothetical protein